MQLTIKTASTPSRFIRSTIASADAASWIRSFVPSPFESTNETFPDEKFSSIYRTNRSPLSSAEYHVRKVPFGRLFVSLRMGTSPIFTL